MIGSKRFPMMLAAGLVGFGLIGATGVARADPPWGDGWNQNWHHEHEHEDHDQYPRWASPQVYFAPPPPPAYYVPPPVYYAPPPPAYYAPPPVYYAPPALSFGINIPLGGDGRH